jgi:catechol 2,3-dioxygenase-like lactoylglutathione lyase family enzyme
MAATPTSSTARKPGGDAARRGSPAPIRSILVIVSDIDQSVRFYRDVLDLHVSLGEDQVAVLASGGAPSTIVLLRQAYRHAVRAGREGIGVRSVGFDVSGTDELDEVERRLRRAEAFDRRDRVGPPGHFEIVRGHDPDRLPLAFFTLDGPLTAADAASLAELLYQQ